MDPKPDPRKAHLVGARVADNVVFRVYDPPKPLEDELHRVDIGNGYAVGFRDFKIASVDFGADGTMVLHSVIKVGEAPDLRPDAPFGARIEEWSHLIAAVINADGHLRAESILVPESPDGKLN